MNVSTIKGKQIYIATPAATITVHPAYNAVELQWHKNSTPNDYKDTVAASFEASIEHQLTALITDRRESIHMANENIEWVVSELLPRFKGNIRNIAIVISGNKQQREPLDLIRQKGEQTGIRFRYFDTIEEAREWVQKCTLQCAITCSEQCLVK